MKGLFVAAGLLIFSFFAGVVYIALSESPETAAQKDCRLAALTASGHENVGYTAFTAMLRDADENGTNSPYDAMSKVYGKCLAPAGQGEKASTGES